MHCPEVVVVVGVGLWLPKSRAVLVNVPARRIARLLFSVSLYAFYGALHRSLR